HGPRAVLGVAYTPDGRLLASSSWGDKTVMIWDATSGQYIRTLVRHTDELGVLAFRPPDGRQLAVAALDGTVTLREGTTGEDTRPFKGASGINTIIAFSPEGRYLATGGGDNRIVGVWDVTKDDDEEIWVLRGRTDALPVVAYSPNGRLLAVASVDQTVRILDALTGEAVRTLRGHRAMLGSVAFSPDSRQLATAGNDAIVKIWDVTELETNAGPEYFPLGRHPKGVRSLAFSPDSRSLASAGPDGTVKIWDATTGRPPNSLLALGPPPFLPAALVNAWVATTGPEVRTLTGPPRGGRRARPQPGPEAPGRRRGRRDGDWPGGHRRRWDLPPPRPRRPGPQRRVQPRRPASRRGRWGQDGHRLGCGEWPGDPF